MRRLLSPRLTRVSLYVKGNRLAEARKLNRAGYSSAAVVMARMAIECRLRELIAANPSIRPFRRGPGLGVATMTLLACNSIQKHEAQVIDRFGRVANKIVHGATTTKLQARELIRRAAKVLSMLERRAA